MIRWIIATSLRLRYLLLLASMLLIVFGMTQFRDISIDVYPEFAPPRVEVQVLVLGMTAAEVEALVTVPLEEALGGLEGLDVMRSRSVPDLSDIILYFKPGTDLMDARLRVQERVRVMVTELPIYGTTPFMLQPMSSTSRALKIGLSVKDKSTDALIDLALTAFWTIRPRLMRIPGVANVAVWGDRWDVLLVQADPERMRQHGVSLVNVMETAGDAIDVGMFRFASGHEIGTGGFIDTPHQRLGIRHILPALTPEEMAQMPLAMPKDSQPAARDDVASIVRGTQPMGIGHILPVLTPEEMAQMPRALPEDSQPVALGDVASIVRGTQPMMNGDAVINGEVGLMLIVEKLPWGNTLELTRGVEEALAQMAPGLPGVEIDTTIFRPATFIEDAIHNLTNSLLVGCILVVLVLGAFLYEWRVALISCTAIPLSLLAGGLVLYWRGATINTMVLAGFLIALGAVVDDAIVDIENIVRRLRQYRREGIQRPIARVILEASLEVRSAIIYSTLIEVAALLPIFFMQGLSGAFFKPLAISYCLAVAASTGVALTVTPALGLMLLSGVPLEQRESPITRWLQAGYGTFLARILPRPGRAYLTVGVVMVAGVLMLLLLGESLFPAFKERDFLMHWVARPGTSQAEMVRIAKAASDELLTIPGVRNFGSHIGQGTWADEPVGMNFAENWISIEKSADYNKTHAAVQEVVDSFPGLYRDVQTYLRERTKEVLTGTGHGIVVRVSGDNLDILREKAFEVKELFSGIPAVHDVQVDLVNDIPQLQVEVDLAAAIRHGIKPGDVRRAVSTFIASEEAGDIWRGGKNYELHVWSAPKYRNSINAVSDLTLDGRNGEHVRLGDLAKIEMRPTPNVILRENATRRIDVFADVADGNLGSVARELQERLEEMSFPLGYHAEILGEYQERQRVQKLLLILAVVAAAVILFILQMAFGSWRLAGLTMVLLPVALVGGILATGLSDAVISLGTLVGFLTVLGIAARNGILMINHFQHLERYEGETFGLDLVLRGARERLAPILMTALTTMLALVPLVVAGPIPGHEIEHPTAVVILGGLVTSTVLNLFVVPSLYLRFGKSRGAVADGSQTTNRNVGS